MFYLPRICEHCLNPSCVASCPSGAMYKREEDGIVLVDQDRCRGWRMCVSGCPYKKVYFNHRTGKAEKCTFCYPRIEVGPCRRSARRPASAGSATSAWSSTTPTGYWRPRPNPDEQDLYAAQRRVFLDPARPGGVRARRPAPAFPHDWIARRAALPGLRAGQRVTRSPCRCTRNTGRCRWSGTSRRCPRSSTCCATTGHDADGRAQLVRARSTRCGSRSEYLAKLFTAGDARRVATCSHGWPRCARSCGTCNLGREPDPEIPAAVGLTPRTSRTCTGCWRSPIRRALRHPAGARRARRHRRPGAPA